MAERMDLAALAAEDVAGRNSRDHVGPSAPGSTELPIDRVALNPLNQRTETDEDPDEFKQLADTIGEHGVLQPLIVSTTATFLERYPDQGDALDGYQWVTLIGNRRLAAARTAGLSQIPAVVNDERTGSMFEVMLVENSHRRDLAPLREAEAMRRVLDRDQVSRAELARRIGRTRPYVTQRLALLTLIPALRAALEDGALPVKQARELGTLSIEEQQAAADAGPPDWAPRAKSAEPANAAHRSPTSGRRHLPVGNPAAAVASIRAVYTGDDLAELIRLLTAE